jgi:hypothetical protein
MWWQRLRCVTAHRIGLPRFRVGPAAGLVITTGLRHDNALQNCNIKGCCWCLLTREQYWLCGHGGLGVLLSPGGLLELFELKEAKGHHVLASSCMRTSEHFSMVFNAGGALVMFDPLKVYDSGFL